jgi:hypothetical protein
MKNNARVHVISGGFQMVSFMDARLAGRGAPMILSAVILVFVLTEFVMKIPQLVHQRQVTHPPLLHRAL